MGIELEFLVIDSLVMVRDYKSGLTAIKYTGERTDKGYSASMRPATEEEYLEWKRMKQHANKII